MDPNETELKILFEYMLKIFPERMFDILTQNESIFDINSSINTVFLPNVEFKLLFNTNEITENTKQTIWKYLQLILMSLMGSIKNKSQFGDTADLFETIDGTFLQEKLNESIAKMSDFFDNIKFNPTPPTATGGGTSTTGGETHTTEGDETQDKNESIPPPLPNTEKIFEHLQSLFNGKIGSLAKEFAEEFSKDMKDILDEDELKNATSIKDVLPKLLKNPEKLLSLVKSIHNKVNTKISSGEISRDELMSETQEMMKKIKEMGGVDNFADMFKSMAEKMGGKNSRIDKNALKKLESSMKIREDMRKKLEIRRQNNITKDEKTGELNFKYGEEKQEKSHLEQTAEIDKIMNDLNPPPVANKKNKKNKKK
jgi:hypothetical protein